MTQYASNSVVFKVDAADAGSLTDITSYLTELNGVKVDRKTIDANTLGTTAATYLTEPIKSYQAIEVGGFYDDTASVGPEAILNIGRVTHAVTRSFELTIGGSKKISGECWITAWDVTIQANNYHTFKATLQPTGTITEA